MIVNKLIAAFTLTIGVLIAAMCFDMNRRAAKREGIGGA